MQIKWIECQPEPAPRERPIPQSITNYASTHAHIEFMGWASNYLNRFFFGSFRFFRNQNSGLKSKTSLCHSMQQLDSKTLWATDQFQDVQNRQATDEPFDLSEQRLTEFYCSSRYMGLTFQDPLTHILPACTKVCVKYRLMTFWLDLAYKFELIEQRCQVCQWVKRSCQFASDYSGQLAWQWPSYYTIGCSPQAQSRNSQLSHCPLLLFSPSLARFSGWSRCNWVSKS